MFYKGQVLILIMAPREQNCNFDPNYKVLTQIKDKALFLPNLAFILILDTCAQNYNLPLYYKNPSEYLDKSLFYKNQVTIYFVALSFPLKSSLLRIKLINN
jgi:hypothetical protein